MEENAVHMKCGGVDFTTRQDEGGADQMVVLIADDGDYRHIDIANEQGRLLCHLHIALTNKGESLTVAVETLGMVDGQARNIKATVYGPVVPMNGVHGRATGRSEAEFPDGNHAEVVLTRVPAVAGAGR